MADIVQNGNLDEDSTGTAVVEQPTDQTKEDSLEGLGEELDAIKSGKTQEEEPEQAKEPVAPPAKVEWWKELELENVKTEEDAINWAKQSRKGVVRAYEENAQLRIKLQALESN